MRRATEADREAIVAFLDPLAPKSMFLLANLADYGFDRDHRNAMRLWVAEADGRVAAVLGLTEAGALMPQLPPTWINAAAEAVDGEWIGLILGPAEQTAPLRRALGLADAPTQLDRDEPHFVLDLAALQIPEAPGALARLDAVPRDLLIDWRAAYDREVFASDPEAARATARRDIDHWAERDSHRVLMIDGAPVAMTGFNAMLPGIVQVGGVWTPPELRRRGHAARAVALHLAEARARGVTRATLFAASDTAARVYVGLGFRPIGQYTLCLFEAPVRAGG
jgi:N-acetylglutamate synthase-like GNAT family acetyltransferase